jgi:transcriptional regulator GlxA family with amidase domain
MEAARLSASPAMTEQRTPLRLIADLLIQYIDSDLARPLSLDLFAEKHRMSRRHIERVFRAEFSMSPLEFQQVRRVERARYLLQTTDDSVLSVAQQVGWESGSYLSRVLGKTWARTAAEIRADAKSAKSLSSQG